MIDGSGLMNTALTAAGIDPSCLATDQLLHQVTALDQLIRATTNAKLRIAATFADRFPADSITAYQLAIPGGDRPIRPGGDGTPELTRFCVTDLAATMHKSTGTAERIIADALDLRHRLPHLWQRLCRNEVDALDCQTIARQTRHLTLEQALEVDQSIAPMVGRWSWNKLLAQLEATIIRVDAENIRKLAEEAGKEVGVFMNQSNEHGIKGIYILTDSPAGIRFYAQVSRIADILARRGHTGSKNERMAAAIDVLGNPLDAVRMIAEDTEPTVLDPDPDDDSLFPKATTCDGGTRTTGRPHPISPPRMPPRTNPARPGRPRPTGQPPGPMITTRPVSRNPMLTTPRTSRHPTPWTTTAPPTASPALIKIDGSPSSRSAPSARSTRPSSAPTPPSTSTSPEKPSTPGSASPESTTSAP